MDSIETVILQNVEVQVNGIIRNSKGRLIARLVSDIDFNGEHIKLLNEPNKKDLKENPVFETIWQTIKKWDISRDDVEHRLYAGATGTDVKIILNAIQPYLKE